MGREIPGIVKWKDEPVTEKYKNNIIRTLLSYFESHDRRFVGIGWTGLSLAVTTALNKTPEEFIITVLRSLSDQSFYLEGSDIKTLPMDEENSIYKATYSRLLLELECFFTDEYLDYLDKLDDADDEDGDWDHEGNDDLDDEA